MDRLGILIEDMKGIYIVKQFMSLKPELDYYVIRDIKSSEETQDKYVQKNLRRFHRLGVEHVLCLLDTTEEVFTWSQISRDARLEVEGEAMIWSQVVTEGGEVPELLLNTLEDGYLGRGFTGFILQDYMKQIPKEANSLFLDIPGLGSILPWIEALAVKRHLKVVDPITEFIKSLPMGDGCGRSIFYWTQRDYPFERRVQEILQQKIEFQIWRDLKWFRRNIGELK